MLEMLDINKKLVQITYLELDHQARHQHSLANPTNAKHQTKANPNQPLTLYLRLNINENPNHVRAESISSGPAVKDCKYPIAKICEAT